MLPPPTNKSRSLSASISAARTHDPRITNSEGAGLSTHRGLRAYGNSLGFLGSFPSSRHLQQLHLRPFHLCYGDYGARHFIEPRDMTRLVEVANVLSASISHDIAYFHMPVPVSRTDDDYFRPLAGLNLRGPTEIYLGLVHASDGPDGTRKRIETAQRHLPEFGVASECGMARARTSEVAEQLLKVHAEVTREPA